MCRVKLGEVAIEHKETLSNDKVVLKSVGLEHLIPEEIKLKRWDENKSNTFNKVFRAGHVLFGRRRAYLKKAAITDFEGVCSGDITVIEAISDKIMPALLPFVIQDDDLFNYAMSNSAGSLSPRVKWAQLKEYEFNLPNLNEQKYLSDLLWAANDVKEAYQKMIELTDELAKAQFIEITSNCIKARIGDICNIKARIGWQGLTKKEFLETGDYMLITGVDFQDNKINFERCFYVTKERYEQDDNIKISVGDVLVTKDGTIGKVAIVDKMDTPATLNSGVFVVRDVKGLLDNWFLLHSLLSDEFKNFIDQIKTGATIAHLNQKAFVNFEIPLPIIDLQKQFANIAKQADIAKFELNLNIKNLDALSKSLLKSFTHII